MATRHIIALQIHAGACHAITIANELSRAIQQTVKEGRDVRDDAACAVLCVNLAHALNVTISDRALMDYNSRLQVCSQKTNET